MIPPVGRGAAGLAGVVVLLVVIAGPLAGVAHAHAEVVSSSPAAGQVYTEPPEVVTVQFSERVSDELGGISVLDSSGQQVDRDGRLAPSGDALVTDLPAELPDGTYVVNYRVVSADGHPVTGAIVFGIGEGTVIDEAGVADLTIEGDPPYEIAAAITRFVTYLAAFLAAGLAVFLAFVHDQTHDRWRLAPIVRVSCLVGGMVAVANIAVQAAVLTGDGLTAMTDVSAIRGSLAEGLGWQTVVLLVGLAAVHLSTDTERLVVAQVLAFYGGVTVAVSFVFWGHAREAPNAVVAVVANGLHTTTAMVWFGGLFGLVQVLRWRWRSDEADVGATAAMVARFSTMAGACVAVLLVAGAVLSWQEVGSRAAFTSTTYGRVLLAKVLVVLVVLMAAAYNRFVLVPDIDELTNDEPDDVDRPDDESGGSGGSGESGESLGDLDTGGGLATVTSTRAPATAWSRLANSMRVEVLGIVVVLAITAVLVSVTPARGAGTDEARAFNQTQAAGDLDVNLVVTPAAAGLNALHIQYLDDTGRPVDQPQLLETELALPADDIGPLRQPALRAGPGHFILDDANLPIAGTWEVTLVARLSDFDQTRTAFQVRVAP